LEWRKLAEEFGTPLFVYDLDKVTENYRNLKNAFSGYKSIIAYAVKANSNLSIISHLKKLGAGADCVSVGELKKSIYAGIDRYKIVFSGVGKRDDEIAYALKENILMINLESEAEMKHVESVAKGLGKVARVSIRVNPNVDPGTHPYISTGLHENKFGVEIDLAKHMYIYAKNSRFLEPTGIHFHIGSQLTDLGPIKESAEIVADLTRSLLALDINIKFFDIGGGLGIRYDNETLIESDDYAMAVKKAIKDMDLTIICEPGRYIVGNAGVLLTKVIYEKKNLDKRFIIVDAAMNDLMRPSLYNAYHKIEFPYADNDSTVSAADIVGPVCESGDWLGKGVVSPETETGDLVLVRDVGAYGFTMSSNYNSRGRAAEVLCLKDECRLIRDRESFDDLIRLEKEYMEE